MSEPDLDRDTDLDQTGADDEPNGGAGDISVSAPTVVEVPTGADTARLSLPPDADAEIAALIVAVTSRLTEVTATDDSDDAGPNTWRLAARLGARRRVELPRECRRGGEWSAAARRP